MATKGEWQPKTDDKRRIIEIAYKMLADSYTKSQIKKAIRKFIHEELKGPEELSHQAIEKYISRAKEQMLREVNSGRDLMRAQALAFYSQFKNKAKVKDEVRLRAQEGIVELMGLGIKAPTDEQIRDFLGIPVSEKEGGDTSGKTESSATENLGGQQAKS